MHPKPEERESHLFYGLEKDEYSPEPKIESTDPNVEKATSLGQNITRRLVTKALAAVGLLGTANGVSGGKIWQAMTGKAEAAELEENLEAQAENIAAKFDGEIVKIKTKIETEHPELTGREKALKTIDYLGVALFGWGMISLWPEEETTKKPPKKQHIQAVQYGALITLTAAKYALSDEEGKKHLKEETISNANALLTIGGTIAVVEGITADIEKIFEKEYENEPSKYDQAALITLMASALSPLITTVGSAGVIRKMSNRFADGDKEMMTTLVSHVSNLSGYLFIGDPPFIAICEKYGFWEGIEWQMKTMWPMALYSLYTATYKLNLSIAEKEGLSGNAAAQKASEETKKGLKKNLPILAKILAKSLINLAKYFTFKPQNPHGLEIKIGEVLSEKLINAGTLPFSPKFDQPHSDHAPDIAPILEALGPEKSKEIPPGPSIASLTLESMEATKEPKKESLIKKIYDNSTNVDRIKNALGHELGDVINIFPYQAGCVTFLTTLFEDLISLIENVDENFKEMIIYFMIMIFSMFADNYVACKIGLKLLPNKPHIPLIASIQGGSMSSIGNMSNVTQFSVKDYSLQDSLKLKSLWANADTALIGLAYSKALTLLSGAGLIKMPKAKKEKTHHTAEHATSRRDFLFGNGRKAA